MGKESIEFHSIDDSEVGSAIRKAFRVSVEEKKNYSVTIDSRKYPLADIGIKGVSFYINSAAEFPVGKVVSGLDLQLGSEHIQNLKGKVAHVSADGEKQWLCGLIWLNLKADKKKVLSSVIQSLKEEVLDKNRKSGG